MGGWVHESKSGSKDCLQQSAKKLTEFTQQEHCINQIKEQKTKPYQEGEIVTGFPSPGCPLFI
jgi:hypothetical protein